MSGHQTMPGEALQGVRFWREGDAWLYLAEQPFPQRGSGGRPQASAVRAAEMTIVTLGASLAPPEATLDALRAELERRWSPDAAAALRPAPLAVRRAALQVAEGAGFADVAQAQPSDLPPQAAAFSALLRGPRGDAAGAALRGERGRLRVSYAVELARTATATARLEGRLDGHLEAGRAPDETAAREAILCAVEAGDASWTESAGEGASDALRRSVRADAMARAVASLLRGWPPLPGGTAMLAAEATRTEAAPLALELAADAADWTADR